MVSRSDSESHALLTACALPRGRETTPGVTEVTNACPEAACHTGRSRANGGLPMERPITGSLLATFIEYAATRRVTLLEWHRFAVQHMATSRWRKHAANVCGSFRRREGKCP